jgi:serine/threonine protein kinase
MGSSSHFSPDMLSAYALGRLPWGQFAAVEGHLDGCSDCQGQLQALEDASDSFIGLLHGLAPEPARDAAVARLITRAQQLPEQASRPLPKRVAGLEIVRELAAGGLGVVYLARNPGLDHREQAVKLLLPKFRGDAGFLARFQREKRAIACIKDKQHVVEIFDAGSDASVGPYLVMEHLDGVSLKHMVSMHGALPVAEACELARQAALGLQAAHALGLVHRDVKPSNLMLARFGDRTLVKVIDFGLVKESLGSVGDGDDATLAGTVIGTPDYMAPEQAGIWSKVPVSAAADIYSLGCTLYTLLDGRPPFDDVPVMEKHKGHATVALPRLKRQDLSVEVASVMNAMVDKNPKLRPDARSVVARLTPFGCSPARLRALLDAEPPQSTTWYPRSSPRRLQSRSRRWLAGAVAALVLLVAGFVGFGLLTAPGLEESQERSTDEGSVRSAGPALGTGPEEPVSMTGHRGPGAAIVFAPEGLQAFSMCGSICAWDLKKRRLAGSWWPGGNNPDFGTGLVAISPNGKLIIASSPVFGGFLRSLVLFDRGKGTQLGTPVELATVAPTVVFSPDSSLLAMADNGDAKGITIRVIDVRTGKMKHSFPSGSLVQRIAFSPDGKLLATTNTEKLIRLWSLEEDRQEREFRGHEGAPREVAFSADGKRLFSASPHDDTMRVWDVATGKQLNEIAAGKAKMTCASFWPGGRALTGHGAAPTDGAGWGGSVVLWDLEKGQELKRFSHDKMRHVTALAISPDGYHALSAITSDTRLEHLVFLYRLPAPAGGTKTLPKSLRTKD